MKRDSDQSDSVAGGSRFLDNPSANTPYLLYSNENSASSWNLRTAEFIACVSATIVAAFMLGRTMQGSMGWMSWSGAIMLSALAIAYPVAIYWLPAQSNTRLWSYCAIIFMGYAGIGWVMKDVLVQGSQDLLLSLDLKAGVDVYALAGSGIPGWTAEILGFGYLFYFPYCLGRSYYLLKAGNKITERFFLGIVLVYTGGFAGYILSPALGPRYAQPGTFPPLGPFISPLAVSLVDSLGSPWAVMPSMHVAATALIFLYDLKYNLRWARACFIPVVTLWMATMGLGFHYFSDVMAGLALAITGYWASHTLPLWINPPPETKSRLALLSPKAWKIQG